MSRQKANYFHSEDSFVILDVLKEHADGTLDLGDAQGNLRVGKCPQAEAGQKAKSGTAVLIEEAKKEDPPKDPEKGKGAKK